MNTVPGCGPTSPFMLIGEAPGRTEFELGRPFVGKSGQEQDYLLDRYGASSSYFYRTNIVKEYREGNPDPDDSQISYWTPQLLEEINSCNPKLIIAVGRFAMRWFLGEDAELDVCRGLPRRAGCFDPSRSNRASKDCVIVPVTHPAAGFRRYGDTNFNTDRAKAHIHDDYWQAARIFNIIRSGKTIEPIEDKHLSNEYYLDVTGQELADRIESEVYNNDNDWSRLVIGLDTEGDPINPWSIQVSWIPGTGYTLRTAQPDFQVGISVLQRLADSGSLFITHAANTPAAGMYDTVICRICGLDLTRARVVDTMYALYLLRLEQKGLKHAADRFCGMSMTPYESILGGVGRNKQIKYLESVLSHDWPKPQPIIEKEPDGTIKTTKPKSLNTVVQGILRDIYSDKRNKDDLPTDPYERWYKLHLSVRQPAESLLGPIPTASLDDIPLSQAIYYSARDADATLRLYFALLPILKSLDLRDTHLKRYYSIPIEPLQSVQTMLLDSIDVLPVFEEMQYNGMPGSRPHFESLYFEMDTACDELREELSRKYNNGLPINPGSTQQTSKLLSTLGIQGAKETPTGLISTGKKSLEYLRYKHEAVGLTFDYREHNHIKNGFCAGYLREAKGRDLFDAHGVFKPAHTETRRLSMEDPNLLNVPSRTEIGRRVRACFICPEGYVFAGYDLSQIELRVLAHDSKSPFLCRQFISGADLHAATAIEIFGVTPDHKDFKEKYRRAAKTINFMLVYGAEGDGIYDRFRADGLEGWDPKSCSKLKREVFKLFEINDYCRSIYKQARQLGYMRDMFGMFRFLPNIDCGDSYLEGEAERHALSQRIQGTAQGMIQKAMKYLRSIIHQLQDSEIDIKWRLQIHDELIFTLPLPYEPIVTPIVLDAMSNHCGLKLRVPVLAESHYAQSWDEAK